MNCLVKIARIEKSTAGPEKFNCEHGHCLSEFGAVSCKHGDVSTIPLFGCVLCHGDIETAGRHGVHVLSDDFATWSNMAQELAVQHDGVHRKLGDAITHLLKKNPPVQGEQILVQTILDAMIEGAEAIERQSK